VTVWGISGKKATEICFLIPLFISGHTLLATTGERLGIFMNYCVLFAKISLYIPILFKI